MSEDQLHNVVLDVVSEIKLITGAILHDGNMMMLQIEMLKRFLATGFDMLTREEVVEAFYLNLQGKLDDVYVHYNKELNAEFVGSVLRAYQRWKIAFANQKAHKIAGLLMPPRQPKMVVDYEGWKQDVQRDLEYLIAGKMPPVFWSDRKYYTLRMFGRMPFNGLKTWFHFMKKAIRMHTYNLNVPANTDFARYRFVTINQVYLLFKNQVEYRHCLTIARQAAYWYVLYACVDCGINNIWEDVR